MRADGVLSPLERAPAASNEAELKASGRRPIAKFARLEIQAELPSRPEKPFARLVKPAACMPRVACTEGQAPVRRAEFPHTQRKVREPWFLYFPPVLFFAPRLFLTRLALPLNCGGSTTAATGY
jgi:hypothetical protein